MRTCLRLLPLILGCFPLFACAPVDTGERLGRLEAQMQAQHVADLRLAHVEDRLTEVEAAIGELRGGHVDGKGSGARTASSGARPVQAAQASPPAPAPQQAATPAPAAVVAPPSVVTPPAPASSPVADAMADLAVETGRPAPGASTTPAVPASPAQGGAYAPVPYPQDPLLSGGAPITEPLPGMIFGEEYNMLPGGRRISPNAVAGQKPAPGASATAAAPVQPAQPPMGQAVQSRPAQTPPSPPAQTASSDKAAYASALALYEKSQLAAAEKAFSGFLQQYPQSPLVPNAMYWLGECYYSTDRMDNAIMIFKDVAGKFPKHDKAAASLLKAGYAYAKLGDMENAYFYWQILLDDFPGSAPANLARKRMAGR